jgi:hypothetical protein
MEATNENTETKAKSTILSHYAGSGGAATWTSEGTEKWSRNIPGIEGSLCATQTSSSAPVLQLHDLQGNVVATASLSETETKLLTTYNSTEFGVPSEGKTPPKYAWLGASGLATETAFGTGVATQGGTSYVPQVARDLQTAPVIPPGAFPNGQGTGEQYGSEIPGWYISLSSQESANTLAAWTAEQELLKREAEEQAAEERAAAAAEERGMLEMQYTSSIQCDGGNACAASAGTCKLGSKFGQLSDNGILELTAEVRCSRKMAGIKFRLCFQVQWEGSWMQFECSGSEGVGVVKNTSDYYAIRETKCGQGLYYRAFAWAFAWAPGVTWKSANELSKPWQCAGNWAESVQEFLDNIKKD